MATLGAWLKIQCLEDQFFCICCKNCREDVEITGVVPSLQNLLPNIIYIDQEIFSLINSKILTI